MIVVSTAELKFQISTSVQADNSEDSPLLHRLASMADTGAAQAIGADLIRGIVKLESDAQDAAARAPAPAPYVDAM